MLARKIQSIALAGLLVGAAVVETAVAQQKEASAPPAEPVNKDRLARDLSSYYKNFKLERHEIRTLKPEKAVTSQSFSFTKMAHKSITTSLGSGSCPSALPGGFTILDPQSPSEVSVLHRGDPGRHRKGRLGVGARHGGQPGQSPARGARIAAIVHGDCQYRHNRVRRDGPRSVLGTTSGR